MTDVPRVLTHVSDKRISVVATPAHRGLEPDRRMVSLWPGRFDVKQYGERLITRLDGTGKTNPFFFRGGKVFVYHVALNEAITNTTDYIWSEHPDITDLMNKYYDKDRDKYYLLKDAWLKRNRATGNLSDREDKDAFLRFFNLYAGKQLEYQRSAMRQPDWFEDGECLKYSAYVPHVMVSPTNGYYRCKMVDEFIL